VESWRFLPVFGRNGEIYGGNYTPKSGQLIALIQVFTFAGSTDYTLNQWDTLVGYCERGDLKISNAGAENAIRPFALGRKAWLFADTSQGAKASATCYSLIETAKANGLEPSAYIHHVLTHIADAVTLEQLETLLPWNAELPASKNVAQYG
tara:strand:- start:197 stop:649 length:453 start_codon:yes stop_codon:yes gene_type:complete